MAPFYKTATAFCLVGLFGLHSVAAGATEYKFEVVEVKDELYLTTNLARNGKISVRTSTVEKDTDLVSTLQAKVATEQTAQAATCETLIGDKLKKVFHHSFAYTTTPNYPELVQEALNAGLEEFGKTYPSGTSAWQEKWGKQKVHSVLHLLGASSTKIGCVIGNCVKKVEVPVHAKSDPDQPTTSVLFCELTPAATVDEAAFSEAYFKELIARETKIKDMTEEDLKDPIVTSSADAVVPSILTAGLVAILAAISA
ncbi:uncharacterized protein EMH_0077380 [Eimeria mitis]|uniref:SAG family member n=1 Tax=Eimeria mitis TaxID=44415 RepID=U6K7B4_9EIME|nr:uncharacterized protein EMH_0077380 [Eimeria mitis]CDJ32741.1 hypothetical protein EMH_0077380 [Eimeria mitis]